MDEILKVVFLLNDLAIYRLKKTHFSCLFFKVPAAVEQIQNVTVEEGRNMIKKCNLAAGTSPSPFFWKKVNTSELWYGNMLNITDIRRNQRGEYSCYVNNTCGSDTTTMFIDVQCKNVNITF